jgi:uncharacterized protein (DUF362 family)
MVVLTRTRDYTNEEIKRTVLRSLDFLDYDLNKINGLVVIKPNLCYYWDYSTGETTDPRVVSAVIDWIRQKLGEKVCIVIGEADASAMRTKYAFRILGYEELSREKNVKLVNLSDGSIISKEVIVAGEKFVLPVNRTLLEADLIINVPKLKYHRVVGLTCALKNMFGAIANPRKYVYHGKLARMIVGINKIVKSNIVVVDGIIVSGKTPKKIGVVMTSDDPLTTDFIAAEVVGCNPFRIGYLKLAIKEKVGDVSKLVLVENPVCLEDIKKEFPKQNHYLKRLSWKLQIKTLKWYSRMSGDIIPPVIEEE